MSVCATCRESGITDYQQHDCPGPQYAAILFTRHRGKGITIDHAPAHTRLTPSVLADRNTYLRMPEPNVIVFADQVVYKITGYDPLTCALELELTEDWRPASTPPAPVPPSDPAAAYAQMRARWQETHGNGEPQAVAVAKVEAKEQP